MFDIEQFIFDCRDALRQDQSQSAVRDVVAQAVSDPGKKLPLGNSITVVPARLINGLVYHVRQQHAIKRWLIASSFEDESLEPVQT